MNRPPANAPSPAPAQKCPSPFVMRASSPLLPILTLVAGLAVELAAAPRRIDDGFLDTFRTEIRTNHPSIAAARERVRAADAGVRTIRRWEDPMAGVGFMVADREMRADDGDMIFEVGQMLPRWKLYGAQATKARAERAMLEAETRVKAVDLESTVARSIIELALMDEMIAIETNQIAWLESITANAREMLKDPMANAAEPLRMESELAQERQKLDSARRQRARMGVHLNTLLGRPANSAWPDLGLPESAPSIPSLAGTLERFHEANPMLQSLARNVDVAKSEIETARLERSPVFTVGVESSVYSGGDFRQATLGAKMTLPWFNNAAYRANTERARHQRAAAEKEIESLARQLHGELIAAHTEAENAAIEARTFAEEIIPRAQKAVESIQNAWISSKARAFDVLDARRMLLDARMNERRAVATHQTAVEMLRSIVPPAASASPAQDRVATPSITP